MADQSKVDVLIFEDTPTETGKIAHWFGLRPEQSAIARAFQNPPKGATSDKGWFMVKKEITDVNPRVVVLDYLLTGSSGSDPFDGIEYAKRCKEKWPHLGVIVITTGGDGELEGVVRSQSELDQQKSDHHWSVDCAWVKPWGHAADSRAHRPVRELVLELISRSWRPTEH